MFSKASEIIKSLIERSLYLLIIKKISLLVCYDIIMELRELSELSKDYIAEMLTKLGLTKTFRFNDTAADVTI